MMKTIKRERQVRLDELLRLVWDGKIVGEKFYDQENNVLFIRKEDGEIKHADYTCKTDLFTITEEVEITEETVIDLAYRIETEKGWKTFDKHGVTINKIIDTYKKHINVYLGYIYLLNSDGSIGELIWSKERGLVE